jgi:AP-4 complex subunit sigma-1
VREDLKIEDFMIGDLAVFAAAAAAAPVGCKDCRDSDERKGREGKGREVNLGNSEERVRDPRKEMTIRFVLLVNKQGQTRLAQYYEYLTIDERRALEGEIVRKCLARSENQCSFVEHRNYKIIYRRYASLFFLVGVDGEENELAILEFIHCVVETMDRYFGNVCELDIMFHLEKAHFMLEEMVMNGCIVETNKVNILAPIQLMDKSS